MAIITRERKKGTAVYAVNYLDGEQVWDRLDGTDAREHARADARIKKQIAAGTYAPTVTAAITVGRFAQEWFRKRTNRSAADEERNFDLHIRNRCAWFCALRLEDVRVRHMLRLIDELGQPYEKDGAPFTLAPKSIFNLYGTLRTLFRNARAYELMTHNPCELPEEGKKKLSRKPRRRPRPYTADDVRAILSSEAIDEDERIFCALAFYTGMREGEIAGRRFRDYDPNAAPLGALTVTTQYNDRPLKTDDELGDAPRVIPVHPELAEMLDAWRSHGFEGIHCRKPTEDDFIIPVRGMRGATRDGAVYARTIREAREARGLTLRDFAKAAGVSAPFCTYVEQGTKFFAPENEPTVAKLLGLEASDLAVLAGRLRINPDGRRYQLTPGRNHSRSSAYKLFCRALAKAGIPAHSLHATRHTFISYTRRGGAFKDVLEKITHNAKGAIIDAYTHFDFEPLCEAVSCLSYQPTRSNVVRLPARRAG